MAADIKSKEDYLLEIKEKETQGILDGDKIAKGLLFVIASIAIVIVFLIIIYLFLLCGDFFQQRPLDYFLFGTRWDSNNDVYGAFYIILGTILVALGALAFAIPLGLAGAIFISEVAPPKLRGFLKGGVEILSGIPSIIFGYFGRMILAPFIEITFNVSQGLCWLNASFLLGIMSLPTIISVCEDAISTVPRSFKNASYAMGATKWQTISQVILPAAMSGITAGVILGMGRAIGETMTVTFVAGNSIQAPEPITDVFTALRTITATLALNIGNANGLERQALFALAIILFFMSLIINIIASLILKRVRKKFTGQTKERKIKDFKPLRLIKEDKGVQYVITVIRRHKKLILGCFLFVFLLWLFTNWFGFSLGSLVTIFIFVFFYVFKRISPSIQQIVAFGLLTVMTLVVLIFLGVIISNIISNGLPKLLEPGFLTTPTHADGGGILDALIGTLELTGFSILFAVPLGVLAGLYLSEYAGKGKITYVIRLAIDSLNGTPSIVFGLFGYVMITATMKGRSLFGGVITLSIMILPVIIRTTEEGLKAIPQSFREGSLALGSSKWQSIVKIALPAAVPAIMTGVVLGMGRVAGETAPIIFTACVLNQRHYSPIYLFSDEGWTSPVASLTFYLYGILKGFPNAEAQAGGTALVLFMVVLAFYGIAFVIRSYYNKKKDW